MKPGEKLARERISENIKDYKEKRKIRKEKEKWFREHKKEIMASMDRGKVFHKEPRNFAPMRAKTTRAYVQKYKMRDYEKIRNPVTKTRKRKAWYKKGYTYRKRGYGHWRY